MTDKEKLDLLEDYIIAIHNNAIYLYQRKDLDRLNKVDCAYLEGEIDALNKVREFIKNRLMRGKMK